MEITLVITFALLFIVIFLINYWINTNFNYWKSRGIPHSTATPLTFLYNFLIKRKGILDVLKDDYNRLEGKQFGGFFQMFTPAVMIRDPELLQKVFIKDFMHFTDRKLPFDTSDFSTDNISNLTGERWRNVRYKLLPTFTAGKLKMMFEPIKISCEEAVEFLETTSYQDIEARDFTYKLVLNTMGNLLFGMKVDAFNEATAKDNELLKVAISFFNPSFKFLTKSIIVSTFPLIRKIINFDIINKKTDTFFRKLVKDLIDQREKSDNPKTDILQLMLEQRRKEELELNAVKLGSKIKTTTDVEESEDKELLENMNSLQNGQEKDIKATKVFTDDCIISNAFLFITAGTETQSTVTTFVLYELANNPGLQKRVQKELDDMLIESPLNFYNINSLKYMDQFINETIRLHIPGALLTRVCTQNYKIPGTDVIIEKGTIINIPTIGLHSDPQYFPDPEKFDPDRFVDKDAIPKGVYLSFGSGPRMCIAKRLGSMKLKIFLATVLQKFNVKLSKKMKLPLKNVRTTDLHRAEGGMWLNFESR